MNVKALQQAFGDRMKSTLASAGAVLLALGFLMYLQGGGERPQGTPSPQMPAAVTTPAAQPAPPTKVLGPYKPPTPANVAADTPWPPPVDQPRVEYRSSFVQRLQYVSFVVAMLSLLLWGTLRLLGPGLTGMGGARVGRKKLMNVLERQSLAPGKGLVVVEVAGRHLLLGMSEQGITNLAELTPEEVLTSRNVPAAEPNETAPAAPRNLVKDVLSQHLSAVPGLKSRQRGA